MTLTLDDVTAKFAALKTPAAPSSFQMLRHSNEIMALTVAMLKDATSLLGNAKSDSDVTRAAELMRHINECNARVHRELYEACEQGASDDASR